MHRLGLHRLPQVVQSERFPSRTPRVFPRGFALGQNRRGACIFLDLNAGEVGRLELASGHRSDVMPVPAQQDPLTPGLVGVDETGDRALIMVSDSFHGPPVLWEVDLRNQSHRVCHRSEAPGWVVGAYLADALVVLEQRLGERPLFRVYRNESCVWESESLQNPCMPVAWSSDIYLLLLCLEPDPYTRTGPTQLCALDVVHGTLAGLLPAAGRRLAVQGDMAIVEGGEEHVHATLRAGA